MSALSTRYNELRQLGEELRQAESDLLVAHLNFGKSRFRRPETIYVDVLRLRAKSRQLLQQLGDALVFGSVDAEHSVSEFVALDVQA